MIVFGSPSKKIRKTWRQVLSGSYLVHEIPDEMGLCQMLAHYKPTVLLLDSAAIHHRGIRHLKNLLQASPQTRIIFFTDQLRDAEAVAVLKAGATGYCAKNIQADSLLKAVAVVSRGEIWAERRIVAVFIRNAISRSPDRQEVKSKYYKSAPSTLPIRLLLSQREHDVASMIATGEQNKTISSQLSISEKTVKAHLTNIFRKVGVSSRTQLAVLCATTASL
jgi:two-component system, NarL family, nitrate/nitrite response regulator NarL